VSTSGQGGGVARAEFNYLRYGQCWEDADVLLEALDIQPGDTCLAIASAGDNALSMLSRGPAKVIAVDLNAAQIAALQLRISAYRQLDHTELLLLMGSREAASSHRRELYERCRGDLPEAARSWWDARPSAIERGIGGAGKFEDYFRMFRSRVLPLIHRRSTVLSLLDPKSPRERQEFYDGRWSNFRWRILFRVFFSRFVMGRMGRDPAFFDYVEGSVADRILGRVRHALVELDPSVNPYVHWILTGTHGDVLPHALRPENYAAIRDHIDQIECFQGSTTELLTRRPELRFHRFNLSDIFEYMPERVAEDLLRELVQSAEAGARMAYWNMLAPRSRPETMADLVEPLAELADRLHLKDKAFFYSRFVVEEVVRVGPGMAR
jgi:S-adenosylmethionine-diacylglycerol 3-amino-3-carboxypropyl transferase